MLWESITEETTDIAMDCASFQSSRNTGNARLGRSRRLNMDNSTMHADMTVDQLSFFDEDVSAQHNFGTSSPVPMGLLSLESSPQRFHIVERHLPAVSEVNKFLQPLAARQQKLQSANATSTSSSNATTPAKSFRMFHSASSGLGSMESSMDDEYMELFEMESLEQQSSCQSTNLNFPSDLNSLISGHIMSAAAASPAAITALSTRTPEMRRPSVRRCLSMCENQQQLNTPKTPELMSNKQETAITPFSSRFITERSQANCFKRPDPPSTTSSPILIKRYRGEHVEKENILETSPQVIPVAVSRPPLRKCMSMNDAEIMTALARSESQDQPDLIGDFSKPFALPLLEGRHRDLKSISSDTVARLLRGEFADEVSSYKIIDCRYPYEYEGGHIRGAKNLYTQEQIVAEFLQTEQEQLQTQTEGEKRNIIIFHCEFSSERGPKLSRFLRSNDRARNTNAYPALNHPEVYLLHNGYKEFYETHADLCDPNAYRPMLEPSYNEAYRQFRAKTKSWNGEGLGGASTRLKKSRSRLLL